ncbi:MAG: hypothetical protein K6B14_02380 [Lachnospiraceae bacterium]|nr:hypothetical protein [Lachnospiraceae bacterium]
MLGENDQATFDRIMSANGYDKRSIKFLMKPVEVNSVNMPLNAKDNANRKYNIKLAKALEYAAKHGMKKEEGKAPTIKVRGDEIDVYETVHEALSFAVDEIFSFNLKENMLNDEYISKNFEKMLYIVQKIEMINTLYQKDKELFSDSQVFSAPSVYDEREKKMEECFGSSKNQLYVKFSNMVKAYMKKNLIDETGSFDLGLTNEDVLLDEAVKDKFVLFRDMAKSKLKKENYNKVAKELELRKIDFEKNRGDVDAELNRVSIAEKTAKTVDAMKMINNVEIKSGDKLFSIQRFGKNGGHISDFALLVQDGKLRELMDDYDQVQTAIEFNNKMVSDYKKQLETETDATKRQALEVSIKNGETSLSHSFERKESIMSSIMDYRSTAKQYYDTFQKELKPR